MDHEARAQAFENALRRAGIRITRQRAALLRVLALAEDHPDANQLFHRATKAGAGVSLATVYRTLSALEAQGVILKVEFEGEPARFEPADGKHHDHMIDVDSGEVTEFVSERIEKLQAEIAAELGYEIVRHRLELYVRKKP
ncbi:Fur family transcriptional regulator [Paracoccus aestuariivivens]|uniref:Ferric uptake regulation protein n=1 Tax=Paracoccus aestuariivivens TaxID=1820333 RepID=A0A6L6JEA4_9RHOB|nr:Fur family transcriptional regulator [Paracoccus aestuariivivens]MTH79846.1 transcriptional repressor [Paracoccus aestuariivivens]